MWGSGAEGELATAKYLAERCPRALVLHDRRVPRKGNIDHIAIAPGGVYVIDTKRYKGKKVRVANPLFGSAKLLIGGRDRTKLVAGLLGQVNVVAEMAGRIDPAVPVQGAFCFIDADLPLFGTPAIRGLPVFGRKGLVKRINCDGPLSDEQIRAMATELALALKPA